VANYERSTTTNLLGIETQTEHQPGIKLIVPLPLIPLGIGNRGHGNGTIELVPLPQPFRD